MEEMIVIPRKELPADVQFYKGELTGNALLNQAGQVAAQKKRILHDKTLSAQEIVDRVKPLGRELHRANKKLRQIPPVGGAGGGGGQEKGQGTDEDLVSTQLEKWMQRLAKNLEQPKGIVPPPPLPPRRPPPSPARQTTPRSKPKVNMAPVFPPTPPPSASSKKETPRTSRPSTKPLGTPRLRTPAEFTPPKKRSSTGSSWWKSALEGAVGGIEGMGSPATTPSIKPKKKTPQMVRRLRLTKEWQPF